MRQQITIQQRRLRIRRRPIRMRLWLQVAIALALATTTAQQQRHEQQFCTPPSMGASQSDRNYDWEQLDLYEILGFQNQEQADKINNNDRSKITTAQIRQAYRSMAQRFHPDKTRGAKNITVEESNARFTRIANAYEVLSDPEKRKEYDLFLQHCQRNRRSSFEQNQQQPQQQQYADPWSEFFNNIMLTNTDPRRVFEEFFFGTAPSSNAQEAWNDNQNHYTTANDYGGAEDDFSSFAHHAAVRIQEDQQVMYDPNSGEQVLRVRQIEEYQPDSHGRYYYRIVAQDFAERFDPFHGRGFHPISPPFVLEEGYHQSPQHGHQQPNTQSATHSTSTLRTGEFIFPKSSSVLTSDNGRYYAGVSPECELLIMLDNSKLGENVDDTITWTSETFVPPSLQDRGCFLTLSGPHLVLVLGTPERPGNVLWFSKHQSTTAEEKEEQGARGPSTYIARLDDDGRLAVYQQRVFTEKKNTGSDSDSTEDHWINRLMHGPRTSHIPPTKAAKAWESVHRWLMRSFLHRHQHNRQESHKSSSWSSSSSPPPFITEESCIFATGRAGCSRPLRKIVHIASDVSYSLKLTMSRIDDAIDDFIEFLGNAGDDNTDVVETFLRVMNKAGNNIRDAGHRMAKASVQMVRNTLSKRFPAAKVR